MKGLSEKEVEIIANLEFKKKYFFTAQDIDKYAKNKTQRYNIIKSLVKKDRIIKINRSKYYLIPIKARTGKWTENSLIIADEIFNGEDYVIGGWAASNYWKLTDQIPVQTDIWSTKRQGKTNIMNNRFVFHRTTKSKVQKAVTEKIGSHDFRIISKEDAKQWIKGRD